MENLTKWSSIAFGLSDDRKNLKKELKLAQDKIAEINIDIAKSHLQLIEMIERKHMTCEEFVAQERQLLVLEKRLVSSRAVFIHKIVSACLEGVRSIAQDVDFEDEGKIKLMVKAIKYIQKEKELPKVSEELFHSLHEEIISVFQNLKMVKRKSTLSILDTLSMPELDQYTN